MPKLSFRQQNINIKKYMKFQKEKDIIEIRKKLLRKNLKKRKNNN